MRERSAREEAAPYKKAVEVESESASEGVEGVEVSSEGESSVNRGRVLRAALIKRNSCWGTLFGVSSPMRGAPIADFCTPNLGQQLRARGDESQQKIDKGDEQRLTCRETAT